MARIVVKDKKTKKVFFNTDTGICIHEIEQTNESICRSIELWKTMSGKYFIRVCGEKYFDTKSFSTQVRDQVFELSEEQAMNWVIKNCPSKIDQCEATATTLTLRLDTITKAKLQAIADEKDFSLNKLCVREIKKLIE